MEEEAPHQQVLRFGGIGHPPLPDTNFIPDYDRICIFTFPLEPAYSEWTTARGSERIPDYEHLASRFGHLDVHAEGTAGRTSFKEFLTRMEKGDEIYLRDWHLVREARDQSFYSVPPWCKDDWLDLFLAAEGGKDDYRFVYMGASGTSTKLHVDVLHSFSWSANIVGTKTWVFFPPSQTPHLTNASGTVVTDIRTAAKAEFPEFHCKTNPVTVVQRPGELVFVPSGWWHQVENHGPTMSINHNWINAHNLRALHAQLAEDMVAIRGSIAEHRDDMGEVEWAAHCQLMLEATNAGFGYAMLWRFLCFHAQRYLALSAAEMAPKDVAEHVFALRALLEVTSILLEDVWAKPVLEEGRVMVKSLTAALSAENVKPSSLKELTIPGEG
ncbi:JmjC domain-containing protein 4 [Thoreauomyces humboldtii]|nr:JmjC domain-containing protein 4 [Thoreauomyces humboldtii]